MVSVLIVEDEDSLRKALSQLLLNKGYEVTEVSDGMKLFPSWKRKILTW
jgi:CheY-like chemotaxis protein